MCGWVGEHLSHLKFDHLNFRLSTFSLAATSAAPGSASRQSSSHRGCGWTSFSVFLYITLGAKQRGQRRNKRERGLKEVLESGFQINSFSHFAFKTKHSRSNSAPGTFICEVRLAEFGTRGCGGIRETRTGMHYSSRIIR